jgi:hypothetical protein
LRYFGRVKLMRSAWRCYRTIVISDSEVNLGFQTALGLPLAECSNVFPVVTENFSPLEAASDAAESSASVSFSRAVEFQKNLIVDKFPQFYAFPSELKAAYVA